MRRATTIMTITITTTTTMRVTTTTTTTRRITITITITTTMTMKRTFHDHRELCNLRTVNLERAFFPSGTASVKDTGCTFFSVPVSKYSDYSVRVMRKCQFHGTNDSHPQLYDPESD